MKAIIEAKKNCVDIAFYSEDPFELDELAKKNNVTVIVDCGVAPGMCHILTGYAHNKLDKTESALILVGGLPQVRTWPYEYKVVFSPYDTIEEYTRPARYVQDGKLVTKEALSEQELIDFPEVGTLEAFNSDGIRTLIKTIDAPNVKEKTLRYPGHVDLMKIYKKSGFFDQKEIEINGTKIRPLDFMAKILFPIWKMKGDDKDLTIMKIIVEG